MSPCEYAVPMVPAGREEVVMFKTGELMDSESAAVADADELSVTFTVKLDEPVTAGVPDIVAPASSRPGGSAPLVTDHV